MDISGNLSNRPYIFSLGFCLQLMLSVYIYYNMQLATSSTYIVNKKAFYYRHLIDTCNYNSSTRNFV